MVREGGRCFVPNKWKPLFSKLMSLIFYSKFLCASMRNEVIIVFVLAPFAEEYLKLLNDISCWQSRNVSNNKFIKLRLPIVGFIWKLILLKVKSVTLTLL